MLHIRVLTKYVIKLAKKSVQSDMLSSTGRGGVNYKYLNGLLVYIEITSLGIDNLFQKKCHLNYEFFILNFLFTNF